MLGHDAKFCFIDQISNCLFCLMTGGALGFVSAAITVAFAIAAFAMLWGIICHKYGGHKTARGLARRFKIPARRFKTNDDYRKALEAVQLGEEFQMRRSQAGSAIPDFEVRGFNLP